MDILDKNFERGKFVYLLIIREGYRSMDVEYFVYSFTEANEVGVCLIFVMILFVCLFFLGDIVGGLFLCMF